VLAQLHPIKAVAFTIRGRVDDALREAESAEQAARALGSTEMVGFARAVRLRPLWWRHGPGCADAADPEPLRQLGSAWHRLVADMSAGEALIGHRRTAEWEARMLAWHASGTSRLGVLAPTSSALLAQARLAAGDVAGARRWIDDACATLDHAPLSGKRGTVDAAHAEVLLAEGRPDAALERAGDAVDHFGRCGHAVAQARTRMTMAEALLRQGQVDAARRELGQAKEDLAAAGACWLTDQADRAQRRLGARLPRAGGPAGEVLTSREQEIAELVADGLTNRAIAARLYLSPRTVDAHLARILTKLRVTSRAAIARRLASD
jgi:DNA-binding CsgD family transcriptional regulator